MKLGNSNGNNRGKKYFLRRNCVGIEPTEANRQKANLFSDWFVENTSILVNFLKYKLCFDDDVFNNTFLRMFEKILFTGMDVKDYKAYFHRSYYTNYIQGRVHENRYGDPILYDNRIDSGSNQEELERMQLQLECDVFDYIYSRYTLQEFELFKMYVSLKPAVNYQTLSDITNIKVHTIQRIMSKILRDIRSNKTLMNRYIDIAA